MYHQDADDSSDKEVKDEEVDDELAEDDSLEKQVKDELEDDIDDE